MCITLTINPWRLVTVDVGFQLATPSFRIAAQYATAQNIFLVAKYKNVSKLL